MRRVNIGWTPVEWRITADEAHRYEAANEGIVTLRQMEDMIEAQREQEHMIEMLLQGRNRGRDVDRADYGNFIEVLDTSGVIYTYPVSYDWLDVEWVGKRPKKETIVYFIN